MNIWAHLYKQAMSQNKEDAFSKPTNKPSMQNLKRQYTKPTGNLNGNSNR